MKLSTNTGSQQQRILKYLQENRAMTTLDARTELDIFHPAARVQELRGKGNDIVAHKRWVNTGQGEHEIAEYILMETNHGAET